jgi:hypothetical protein
MGCLTLIILFILGIVGVFSIIANSEPNQQAVDIASKNSKIIEALGEPIEKYGIPTGEMTYNSDSGSRVDFRIPIKGPRGKAILFVKGAKTDDKWVYETLYVIIKETKEEINLLDKSLEGF